MSLSANIKKIRTEKNLTQEQLAVRLGISAQAVSKWETSETYPDGALLVPLAHELGVSLDTLFENDTVYMADISHKIISLMHDTEVAKRFHVARDICWQIERGMFDCHMDIDKKYDPEELEKTELSSYILDDTGFTMVSNGKEPFFAVFEQPQEGFGAFLDDKEILQRIFSTLAREETWNVLVFLYRKEEKYVFESAVLARECNVAPEQIDNVMDDLIFLKAVYKQDIIMDGKHQTLYYSQPDHKILALCLMARECMYKGAYRLQRHHRNKPFLES